MLRIVHQCTVHPSIQIIPLKYITSVECHKRAPPCIVIQYNTLHEYHRAEIEYSSYGMAEGVFNELQKGLEGLHGLK